MTLLKEWGVYGVNSPLFIVFLRHLLPHIPTPLVLTNPPEGSRSPWKMRTGFIGETD
jgi:hypothetical protein